MSATAIVEEICLHDETQETLQPNNEDHSFVELVLRQSLVRQVVEDMILQIEQGKDYPFENYNMDENYIWDVVHDLVQEMIAKIEQVEQPSKEEIQVPSKIEPTREQLQELARNNFLPSLQFDTKAISKQQSIVTCASQVPLVALVNCLLLKGHAKIEDCRDPQNAYKSICEYYAKVCQTW